MRFSNDTSDEQLVTLWQNRKVNASPLYAALQKVLTRLLASELRRRALALDSGAFDDLVQELLIAAWQCDVERFDPSKGSLPGFLKKKLSWRLIDQMRRSGRYDERNVALEVVMSDRPEALPSNEETPLVCLEAYRQERARQLRDAIVRDAVKKVKNKDARRCIEAHDLRGEALQNVGQRLGVHGATAGRYRKRGLEELRSHLVAARIAA